MYIEQLYTNCLAEAAYYIESEGEVAIVDPIRETSPYIDLAEKRNAKIKYVFETHFHADFVSGHIDLASKTGAQIVFGPLADTNYKVYNANDGEFFQLGKLKIKVLHTPGHTPESSCFLLYNQEGEQYAVFTGDTLFVGDVGRPDLLDGKMTKEELGGMLYDSLNAKIKTLADHVIVYPAHGPGSSCGKNIGKETFSTIGEQKRMNYALQEMSKDEFIKALTCGLTAPPPYFFKDAYINKMGYQNIEEVIQRNSKELAGQEFAVEIEKGALVLDTRDPDNFEKGFIKNSINIGLNGAFAIWAGTLLDINQPLLIVADSGKEQESIVRLARVGYEKVIGFLKGGIESWMNVGNSVETIASLTAEELQNKIGEGIVLDVRKTAEVEGGHIKDSVHLELTYLAQRADELNKNNTYFVHCAGGYRSMMAVSILKSKGFENLYNIYGGFGKIKSVPGIIVESTIEV